jgi:murein DD-endopeptidase MepM/ murein hydrolase activator NlpD
LAATLAVLGIFISGDRGVMAANASKYSNNTEVKNLTQQIEDLEKRQKEITKLIRNAESEKKSLLDQKEYYDILIYTVECKIDAANELINELTIQQSSLKDSIAKREADILDLDAKIRERIRVSYESGDISSLEMILGAESITDFFICIDNMVSILEYDTRLLKDMQAEKLALSDEMSKLAESKAKQQEVLATFKDDQAELDRLIEENTKLLRKAEDNRAKYERTQEYYKKQEEKKSKELEDLLKELEAKEGATKVAEGEFIWPVPTKNRRISSAFGYRILFGKKEHHNGIDIPCPYGTEIYASNSGTVVKAEYNSSYGYYVLINHGGGIATLYGHCRKLNVSEGDTVTKGQVIAHVGSTGHSTGNHVHFEVRKSGVRINPLTYVKQP